MSSSRNNSGTRRGGRQPNDEARTTREGQYAWKDKNCQVMLELVIEELKADDYRSRMPDVAARRRIENKYFELMGDKISWDPEINNKTGYLRKLWVINGQLINRTGVAVNPSTGQIDMTKMWWTDRIAEYGNKGKFVRVLQKKPMPFKDLLDQIFGEHDVDQDERYSPHMLSQNLLQIQPTLPSSDGIIMDQQEVQISEPTMAVANDHGAQPSIRNTPARCPPRRRANFEKQVQSEFQRVIDTRQEFLEELRSRKVQKLTYGDATAVLEKLPIEQLGIFWWAANKLLKSDEDVREAFMKLESEEIKIRYLESLLGTDRYGHPCNFVNLTSPNLFQNIGMIGSSSMGTEIGRTEFTKLLGIQSSGLEESTKQVPNIVNILDDGMDGDKLA
ncbi:uncharacterized protein LOC112087569 isoform X1 [Eutrema salsugineum]|uniref:uncharacterized protein LOC112087569 isoform X1 n=1 Tax=Eutrema salsugineum TaxID=72664 RepID=UPI000CED6380|nr:uncharacterized protein LOC112087569 isoform X1 [Eutrema salsugineum]